MLDNTTTLPALYTDHGHPEKTKLGRFHTVPTSVAIAALSAEGYVTTQARVMRPRKGSGEYARHLVRMRHEHAPMVGDSFPEIVIVNANDGSSSLRVMAGLYRLVCSNGLIVSTATIGAFSIRHSSRHLIPQFVRAHVAELADATTKLGPTIQEWQRIPMTLHQQEQFAERAMNLRGLPADTPIRPYQLTVARRTEDTPETLWNIYNRVQENLSRPGVSATRVREDGTRRRVSLRELRNIPQTLTFNTKLWELATEFAQAA
jgi:hypothetical protein